MGGVTGSGRCLKSTIIPGGPGRPVTVGTPQQLERLKVSLLESKSWSVRELGYRLGFNKSTVLRMLKDDLGMVKKLATWVPHTLTEIQREMREELCYCNLSAFRNGIPQLESIIAIDES